MADDKRAADNKAAAEKISEDKAKVVEVVEKRMSTGKPTPTQAELNALNLGHHVELEPDGAEPDPRTPHWARDKALEGDRPAGQGGGYQTRDQRAAPRPASTGSHPGSHS